MNEVEGRRIYPDEYGVLHFREGDYGYSTAVKCWQGRAPGQRAISLEKYTIEEHEDGTITVKPSIVIFDDYGQKIWQGRLEQGIWKRIR